MVAPQNGGPKFSSGVVESKFYYPKYFAPPFRGLKIKKK